MLKLVMKENGHAQNGCNSTGNGENNRVFLWINPRSVSSAFEKCIANVPGVQVWHAPYTICYWNEWFKTKPHRTQILQQYVDARKEIEVASGKHMFDGGNLIAREQFNMSWVQEQLDGRLEEGKNFLFCKNAAYAIDGHYDKLPEKVKFQHTFMIRDPRRRAVSRMLLQTMSRDVSPGCDMHFEHSDNDLEERSHDSLYALYQHVRNISDVEPAIIDADDLVTYPEKILPKYFDQIGLQYDDKYLKWDSSVDIVKSYYGCKDMIVRGFNQGVYNTAFTSSEFQKPSKGPPKWKDLNYCELKYASDFADGYKMMYDNRIKPF